MCIYCRLRSLVGTPLFNQSEKYKLCEDTSKKGAFLRWRLTIETKEQNVNQSFYDIKMYLLHVPPELCSHLATFTDYRLHQKDPRPSRPFLFYV
jgi:hypothetical protein